MKNWLIHSMLIGALVSPIASVVSAHDGEEHHTAGAAQTASEVKQPAKKHHHSAKRKQHKKKCPKEQASHQQEASTSTGVEHEISAEHRIEEETGKTNR